VKSHVLTSPQERRSEREPRRPVKPLEAFPASIVVQLPATDVADALREKDRLVRLLEREGYGIGDSAVGLERRAAA
jgi:hypothetical protein